MTWKRRRFRSPKQLRRRARAEERSAQKNKRMCSWKDGWRRSHQSDRSHLSHLLKIQENEDCWRKRTRRTTSQSWLLMKICECVEHAHEGRDRARDESGRRQRDAEVDGSWRSRGNDEGKAERTELTERNACDDSREEVWGSWQKSDSNTMGRSRETRTSEIQASLEGLQSMSRAHTARDVFTNTVDTLWKRCWRQAHTTETAIQSQTTSQCVIDLHTAFVHAYVYQDLLAEPPEPDEWYDAGLKEDEVWRLNKALYGYRKAPKLWHQHLVSILEILNCHPTPDGSELLPKRRDEHKYFHSCWWRLAVRTEKWSFETGWTPVKTSFDENHRTNGEIGWQTFLPG